MRSRRIWAGVAGILAGGAGLAVSLLLSGLFGQRLTPLSAMSETVTALTPGSVVEAVISAVGNHDKQLLVTITLLVAAGLSAIVGRLALHTRWAGWAGFGVLGVVELLAVYSRSARPALYVATLVGIGTAMVVVTVLVGRIHAVPEGARTAPQPGTRAGLEPSPQPRAPAGPQPRAPAEPQPGPPVGSVHTRRQFLALSGTVAVGAALAAVGGRALSHGRVVADKARKALRLPVSRPDPPAGVSVDVKGVTPWVTRPQSFYRVDTAFSVPQIAPEDWQLRVHGMVRRELRLDYQDLVDLGLDEHWLTLCCVSNPVGGSLIGNAWWSGVLTSKVLARAGPTGKADAVLSRSQDGWTAGTPLSVLMDNRKSMFAVAMNGKPLLPQHGFPVRMVVPGLYGYVSATKWVVDVKVTRFDDIEAFWTKRGWAPKGPVKTESRIDVPDNGASIYPGRTAVAGVAWAQHRGIKRVEVRVDRGDWHPADLGTEPNADTWRQWVYHWDATPGNHTLQVRATDGTGATQTGKVQGVLPNGATGWDVIGVDVTAP